MMDEARGENPAGFDLGVKKDAAMRILAARDDTIATRNELASGHVNRINLQPYVRLILWRPAPLWAETLRAPALFMVPENDALMGLERNKEVFKSMEGPKTHVESGRGHLSILEGDNLPELMRLQSDFVWQALKKREGGEQGGILRLDD